MAAAIAFAPISVIVAIPGTVAQAAPCAGAGSNPVSCQRCMFYVNAYHTANVCNEDKRGVQGPASNAPTPVPQVPIPAYEPPPLPPPVQQPVVLPPPTAGQNTVPVLEINPPGPDAPRNAPVVAPPRGLDAPSVAIAAAKAAPVTRADPANPPKPPTEVDFNQQVQNVVNAHRQNVDILKIDEHRFVRPRHWDYVDYDDAYRRPTLYNPLNQAMTFRYFYNGAYQQLYLPRGARMVLDAATVGVVPFTAVGDSYVAAGSFYGGGSLPLNGYNGPPPPDYKPPAPPKLYDNVVVSVPAKGETVEVGHVAVVGHDGSQSPGSQDTFLLDDSTLAWGQIDNSSSAPAQIRVIKTQPTPGVGLTDDGGFLVLLAVHHPEPGQPHESVWTMALRFGGFAVVVGLVAWLLNRRNRSEDDAAESS
ncbi:hypothetical protein JF770_05745 [Mycobacterium intracellulare]|uniref:hypothetical protein n=1 Tax=Mycobacterium intracellulare TaxID=1767 RepID=UPI001CD97F37|nr:hypothetical protein [Mycobacterium intracellulare]MCA2254763.1 hypothetical protein [Mycobacterium intracellulare]MCA2303058.1 hypothetical protein [Mycobacterium intracellulare]MCA2345350.1 hypothetical protein [Mycobacterium intracellulare]